MAAAAQILLFMGHVFHAFLQSDLQITAKSEIFQFSGTKFSEIMSFGGRGAVSPQPEYWQVYFEVSIK